MKRVLIADDDAHVVRVLRLTMERAGYTVETVANGEAALKRLVESHPDALVTDIKMPKMTGQQLCDHIAQQIPNRMFPIFIMTSCIKRDLRDWVKNISGTWFLEKPVSPRKLVKMLDHHIR